MVDDTLGMFGFLAAQPFGNAVDVEPTLLGEFSAVATDFFDDRIDIHEQPPGLFRRLQHQLLG
jgi:hypothetical protein